MESFKDIMIEKKRENSVKRPPNTERAFIIDNLRKACGDDKIDQGVGSFGYYLGRLAPLTNARIRLLWAQASESGRTPNKLFWYLVKEEIKKMNEKAIKQE